MIGGKMGVKDIRRGQIYKADLRCKHDSSRDNNVLVLIVQNDVGNHYSQTTIVVPVENQRKSKCETQYEFVFWGKRYCVYAERIRVIDKSRLLGYVGAVNNKVIEEVTKRVRAATDFVEGRIFWADLGETVGSEQWGVRPVLVVQDKKRMESSKTTIVVPLTSRRKLRLPTHHRFYAFHRRQTACAEQIRMLEKDKLREPIGALNPRDRDAIKRCCEVAISGFAGKN